MVTSLRYPTGSSSLFLSYLTASTRISDAARSPLLTNPSLNPSRARHFNKQLSCTRTPPLRTAPSARSKLYCGASAEGVEQEAAVFDDSQASGDDGIRRAQGLADWERARDYKESGVIFEGRIMGHNGGGLLVRFHSLLGFLPFPLLSPYYSCKDPTRSIQEIAKDLVGSSISVKVHQVNEDERNLILSEKDVIWSKFSGQVNVGDIFEARVGAVEDYGAFVHLRFPDGCYYITGLIHVSEVSWDLVQDVRDILNEGDEVKVKVIQIDREKSRITLSLKQLEDDPLLETLDKVIPQVGSGASDMSNGLNTEPLPGLESISKELLQEDGITDVKIGRKGFEKRVVSQDLELWLSNAPVKDRQFTLLARAGREVQEVYVTTDLNQEDIKKAVQRVLSRIP